MTCAATKAEPCPAHIHLQTEKSLLAVQTVDSRVQQVASQHSRCRSSQGHCLVLELTGKLPCSWSDQRGWLSWSAYASAADLASWPPAKPAQASQDEQYAKSNLQHQYWAQNRVDCFCLDRETSHVLHQLRHNALQQYALIKAGLDGLLSGNVMDWRHLLCG